MAVWELAEDPSSQWWFARLRSGEDAYFLAIDDLTRCWLLLRHEPGWREPAPFASLGRIHKGEDPARELLPRADRALAGQGAGMERTCSLMRWRLFRIAAGWRSNRTALMTAMALGLLSGFGIDFLSHQAAWPLVVGMGLSAALCSFCAIVLLRMIRLPAFSDGSPDARAAVFCVAVLSLLLGLMGHPFAAG